MQNALEQSQHTGRHQQAANPTAGPANSAAGPSTAALTFATAGASAAAAPDPVSPSLTSEAPAAPSTTLKGRPQDVASVRPEPAACVADPTNATLTSTASAPKDTAPPALGGVESARAVSLGSAQSQAPTMPSIQPVSTNHAPAATPISRTEILPQGPAAVPPTASPESNAPAPTAPLDTVPTAAAPDTAVAGGSSTVYPTATAGAVPTAPSHATLPGASGAVPGAVPTTAPVPRSSLEASSDEETPAKTTGPPA